MSFTAKQREAMKFGLTRKTNKFTTIPNHTGDMPEGTLRAILMQAGIDVIDFIKKSL